MDETTVQRHLVKVLHAKLDDLEMVGWSLDGAMGEETEVSPGGVDRPPSARITQARTDTFTSYGTFLASPNNSFSQYRRSLLPGTARL